MRSYRAAVVQLDTQNDKMENLRKIEAAVDEAAAGGARLISFPEDMNLLGRNVGEGGGAEPADGLTVRTLAQKCREKGVYVHIGGIHRLIEGDSRCYNMSLLLSPQGEILAEYHKLHLFDVTLADGRAIRESDRICPGQEIVTADTELGCLGFSVCYDLRFPELYRLLALRGAQVLLVPADFTHETGQAHWEVLLRARAVENGCYVIAAGQCGEKRNYRAWGHSMIVDPWGKILAQAGEEPGILYAEIDLDRVDKVRGKIPALQNRRTDIYSLTG